jgi:hypothetical protein
MMVCPLILALKSNPETPGTGRAGDEMPYQSRSLIDYLIPLNTKTLILLTTSYEYCKVPGNYIFVLAWGYLAGARVLQGRRFMPTTLRAGRIEQMRSLH